MSPKKVFFWLGVLAGAALCLWVGFKIAPEEPTLRILGLFIYFYICVELAMQMAISRRDRKKREEGKNRTREPDGVSHFWIKGASSPP